MRSRVSMSYRLRLRGQAELIGALLAVTALIVVLTVMMSNVNILQFSGSQAENVRMDFQAQRMAENVELYEKGANTVCAKNVGAVTVEIVRIWLQDNVTVIVINPPLELKPGEERCTPYLPSNTGAVVTARGNIFKLVKTGGGETSEYAETAGAVEMQELDIVQTDITDLSNATGVYVDPTLITEPTRDNIVYGEASGIKRYAYYYRVRYLQYFSYRGTYPAGFVVAHQSSNVIVEISGCVGNAFIAYRPGDLSRYNIMLTGPGVDCGLSVRVLTPDGRSVLFQKNYDAKPDIKRGKPAWRIKIIGFTPDIPGGRWLFKHYGSNAYTTITTSDPAKSRGYWWYYGGTPHFDVKIEINMRGIAEKVVIYETRNYEETSYTPYMFVGDYDGNGFPEIVFTTEDTAVGPRVGGDCVPNDFYIYSGSWWRSYGYALLDYSTKPFLVYLPGYKIDASKYSLVIVAVRLYYHDGEGGDTECVDDPQQFMFGVYLVDPGPDGKVNTADDRIVSSSELIYQQLDDIEDTYPPNRNFVTMTIPILVPNDDKEYVLAFGFTDPYLIDSGRRGSDDVEYTIAVETVGLSYYSR